MSVTHVSQPPQSVISRVYSNGLALFIFIPTFSAASYTNNLHFHFSTMYALAYNLGPFSVNYLFRTFLRYFPSGFQL